MNKSVFMDTSFLIALVDEDDKLHLKSVSLFERIITKNFSIFITDAVIIEFGNSLSKIGWRQLAYKWILQIYNSKEFFNIIKPNEKMFHESHELYGSRIDKQWSLCDCISFIVMKSNKISESLSFDRHFEQAGFTILQ
jgi:uncharacterized protein